MFELIERGLRAAFSGTTIVTRSIALIGMRGAGKSAVGRELAARLNLRFTDTDTLIAVAAGRTIADIFACDGEAEFRRMERHAIQQAIRHSPAVISVGGGAVLDPENVDDLRSVATVVWLTAPVTELHARLAQDPAGPTARPALTGLPAGDELCRILAEREPLYRAASDLVFDTVGAAPSEIAGRIAAALGHNLSETPAIRPGE